MITLLFFVFLYLIYKAARAAIRAARTAGTRRGSVGGKAGKPGILARTARYINGSVGKYRVSTFHVSAGKAARKTVKRQSTDIWQSCHD